MAHFRRRRSRRSIRCSMCTPYRWRGNSRHRFKDRETADRHRMAVEACAPMLPSGVR